MHLHEKPNSRWNDYYIWEWKDFESVNTFMFRILYYCCDTTAVKQLK